MKQHIRGDVVSDSGDTLALCGKIALKGEWKAGAAFHGLRILGMGADEFCAECSRLWLREVNTEKDE